MAILLRPLIKYGLIALAVLAVLFGTYMMGRSNGHTAGYQEAWAKQQTTIQAMVDKENAQTSAQNAKISKLEQTSSQVTQAAEVQTQQQIVTVTKVVTKYVHDNPKVAASCGWDPATVQAINGVLDSQNQSTTIQSSTKQTTHGVQNEVQPRIVRTHLLVAPALRLRHASGSSTAAHRSTETTSEHRSQSVAQVSAAASTGSSALQSGAVFEYHSGVRDPVRRVSASDVQLVGPDVGRLQSDSSSGSGTTTSTHA